MRYLDTYISLQEVPGEISMIFQITNCPHRCPGCHSKELWSDKGIELNLKRLEEVIGPYKGYLSCICFFGGEWDPDLAVFLRRIQIMGLKTCLYTGADSVSDELEASLNYLKVGSYIEKRGGLESESTNQVFHDLDHEKVLNNLFVKEFSHIHQNLREPENVKVEQ